ncbi:hypothetical protein PE36_17665 [Moritella sp. PE36]|uniref:hypothetical protein n=1 Tax=Moritella sp. PE36 TaxID=58051 RepID=UPI0001568226|nr:hypothetical protein [Moritella sp. PE36]EDM67816.1 hypothetical protein PE36_17665 [Moritella sp. PE36]
MDTGQLNYYPKLKTILSEKYSSEIKDILSSICPESSVGILNIYSVFVDVAVRQSGIPYNALDIKNNEGKLNHHFSALIGFVYCEMTNISITARGHYSSLLKRTMSRLASQYNMSLQDIKIRVSKISDDVQNCITQYQSMNVNASLVEYYSGWACKSKELQSVNLHIARIHDAYGSVFTKKIYVTISNYIRTQKITSARGIVPQLTSLLNEFTEHCLTIKALKHSLKAENSTAFMLNVFNSMLLKTIINEQDVRSFTVTWSSAIIPRFTSCFIEAGLFEEPLKPFITPLFKGPKTSSQVISLGGKSTQEEKDRWFVDIPLEIKDEETLNIIHQRLNRDLEHIRVVSQQLVDDIIQRHGRNIAYIKKGKVKPHPYHWSMNVPAGSNYLETTIATFYHHGFGVGSDTGSFLGFPGEGSKLIHELNLPTSDTLMAFTALLVLEHPKITPSWLQEWVLFDEKNTKVGLKQVGKQWIAISYKNRKGPGMAQQEVVLTEYSKILVDGLIEHTQIAREALKKKGGNDWRYMMLTANVQKPRRTLHLNARLANASNYQNSLVVDSFDENGVLILSKSDAKGLASLITPRGIRKARGLQIYLETHSIKAVAEALGHKEAKLEILKSYLPESLMDYFNSRWVRIFQNAIIFEALQDSPYLFDALDFDAKALDEFLKNHRLGDLPEHLERAGSGIEDEKKQIQIEELDELTFTLSTPLFQVLIAIQHIIENAVEKDLFSPIIEKWYESAVFVLSHFSLIKKAKSYRTPPLEAKSLYDKALNNPLNLISFKENMLCR